MTVEKLNGVEAAYQREYEDLNSEPAKAFKEKFEKEVFSPRFSLLIALSDSTWIFTNCSAI